MYNHEAQRRGEWALHSTGIPVQLGLTPDLVSKLVAAVLENAAPAIWDMAAEYVENDYDFVPEPPEEYGDGTPLLGDPFGGSPRREPTQAERAFFNGYERAQDAAVRRLSRRGTKA